MQQIYMTPNALYVLVLNADRVRKLRRMQERVAVQKAELEALHAIIARGTALDGEGPG